MSGQMHQVAAIQVGNDVHARRQEVLVEELDLLVQGGQNVVPVGAFAQQHDTGDHVRIVHYFGQVRVICFAHLAQADLGSLLDGGDIAHADRNPILRLQHDCGDVFRGCDQSHGPDVDGLFSALDEAAARIDVVIR